MLNTDNSNQIILRFEDEFREHRKDLSAVRLTSDNYLWLGSDETSSIERLTYNSELKLFKDHKQFQIKDFIDLPAPEDQEIDIEGMAYIEPYLWFVGSHSWKRKKPKPDKTNEKNVSRLTKLESEPNRYLLGRIPLINGELHKTFTQEGAETLTASKLEITPRGNLLMDALANDPHLGSYIGAAIPGKENGFDIEGLAIYENRIYLGMRGPVLRGWAVILEIKLENSNPETLILKSIGAEGKQYKKHFIDLNGLGIRDLCLDGEDLLVLAGPTMDLDGPVRIYCLEQGVHLPENSLSQPQIELDIPYGDGDDHAEGITLIDDIDSAHSLLVLYDAPAPSRLQGEGDVVADIFHLKL
ncbi:DUF3616 domain-containing protein [Gloeocapsopsis dulcis]|uniref:DUF3616 domain-containing protein n=1 Tax=Gloeocapsopsis dulcis AAB1 = 1H9 TaxID=1433147 RepID=A0A6N8FZ28_9CHRO|nr:DUF3616 domain-containing protein [Gloeocapsopsis dulcis]MUL37984.1 hypothetical protein [Gloeocapsopsis dulcis AAB1 = 1H9]WNN91538.1 DUF3616 domain-containing protein [Gloeocapsopsis dulcis]